MQNTPAAAVSPTWWQRVQARGALKRLLWMVNGCLVGVLLLFIISQRAEVRRQQQAVMESAQMFDRLAQSMDRRLDDLAQTQAELSQDLLQAGAAALSKDVNPALLRPKLRRMKNQIETAAAAVDQFNGQLGGVGARFKLRQGADLLTESQREGFEALVARLEATRREVVWFDNQFDGVLQRWAQLVEKETGAEKAAQERLVQLANAEAHQANTRVRELAEALHRSEARTEQVRLETLQEATLATVQHLQTTAPAQFQPDWVSPVMYPPPIPYTYGHPYPAPVYAPVYPRYSSRYYGQRFGHGYLGNYAISYGCRYPRTVRIGPYLVVN